MPIQDYVYSIEDDFVINHKVDITILQLEVEASSIITTQLHHIYANLEDDECQVWFFDVLSAEEETELDAIVAAHTGLLPGGVEIGEVGDAENSGEVSDLNISFGDAQGDFHISFASSCYDIGFQFIFPGTNVVGHPIGIKTILKGEGAIKLFDRTNNKIIFAWEDFDNITDYTIFSKELGIGFPPNEAILEIWGRDLVGVSTELQMTCFQIIYSHAIVDNEPPGGTITDPLPPPSGNRVTDQLQLLYEFLEESGTTVADTSGVGTAHDLTIDNINDVTWLTNRGLVVDADVKIKNDSACAKLHDACVASNEVTIEAWIKPSLLSQGGPARIVSYTLDGYNGNTRLCQDADDWCGRCRTTTCGSNGSAPATVTSGNDVVTNLCHVVYTRSTSGVGKIYFNGVEIESNSGITGDLSNWDTSHRIVLANDYNDTRTWLGELHLAAFYSKALSATEVMDNFSAGLQ